MFFEFTGSVTTDGDGRFIKLPFNVWEVCDTKGALHIEGTACGKSFSSTLDPLGNGLYRIPVDEKLEEVIGDQAAAVPITFSIQNRLTYMGGDSPYSTENPIRKVDSMKLITQPNDGLCGQTCIAMLAGVSLDEACEIMRCRDWQASMGKMIDTLDYLGIAHADIIHYTQGADVTLPKCAILMEKMGRYSHYLVIHDGIYYDPTAGIIDDFDMANLVGYLEIKTF